MLLHRKDVGLEICPLFADQLVLDSFSIMSFALTLFCSTMSGLFPFEMPNMFPRELYVPSTISKYNVEWLQI